MKKKRNSFRLPKIDSGHHDWLTGIMQKVKSGDISIEKAVQT